MKAILLLQSYVDAHKGLLFVLSKYSTLLRHKVPSYVCVRVPNALPSFEVVGPSDSVLLPSLKV